MLLPLPPSATAALVSLRRTTVLGPLVDAWQIRAVVRHVSTVDGGEPRVLGPPELSPYIRLLATPTPDQPASAVDVDYVVLRQHELAAQGARMLALLSQHFRCTLANRRFLVFAAARPAGPEDPLAASVASRVEALLTAAPGGGPRVRRVANRTHAILVTTKDRPAALQRMLPQVAELECRVLLVDDGSSVAQRTTSEALCDAHGIDYLWLPSTRGLSTALNVGLSYLLADPACLWISYFQDDVDVHPDVMRRLRLLEDASVRPLLTGYDSAAHPIVRGQTIDGVRVVLKRSTPAVHLHAHADYWRSVMPIPSEYLGAPRRRWEASLEDYWIVNHAPASLERRGLLVTCVPGLVRTFLWSHGDSTWGNPNAPEPPLAPREEL